MTYDTSLKKSGIINSDVINPGNTKGYKKSRCTNQVVSTKMSFSHIKREDVILSDEMIQLLQSKRWL